MQADSQGFGAQMTLISSIHACAQRLTELRVQLIQIYGRAFVGFLIVIYCGLKGLVFTFCGSAQLPTYQRLGVSGRELQLAQVVTMTPWAAKGWIGVMSDCFPIGRYHKRGYLLLSSVFGIGGILCLIISPALHSSPGPWLTACMFMMVNMQLATFDLLAEGKYAELMNHRGGGSEVMTLVWACINFGGLFASLLVYTLVDRYGAQPLLALGLVPSLWALILARRGAMPEEPARSRKALMTKLWSQPRLFALAGCMALGALTLACAAAFATAHVRLVITISVSVTLAWLSFHALPRTLAMSNLYMFLSQAAYMDLSGPLAYYFTAGQDCVPDGPGFSYGYYLAIGNFVGAIGGGIGSVLFQGMSHWTFQQAFQLTTMIEAAASVFDLIIVKRWNIMMGISDPAMYLFGDAACQQLASMLLLLPGALLTSRLCPRGAEATVYAILAGFSNFGQGVSSVLGATMAEVFGIDSSGAARPPNGQAKGTCNFVPLPYAIVLGHMCFPLLILPLSFWMLPAARMDDEDAFALTSPPPSFRSPGSSPASSPRSPHEWPGMSPHSWPDVGEGYAEMPPEEDEHEIHLVTRDSPSDPGHPRAPGQKES